MDAVFQSIDFTIHKGLVTLLVVRLPSINIIWIMNTWYISERNYYCIHYFKNCVCFHYPLTISSYVYKKYKEHATLYAL